jgi:hypothetical protein
VAACARERDFFLFIYLMSKILLYEIVYHRGGRIALLPPFLATACHAVRNFALAPPGAFFYPRAPRPRHFRSALRKYPAQLHTRAHSRDLGVWLWRIAYSRVGFSMG